MLIAGCLKPEIDLTAGLSSSAILVTDGSERTVLSLEQQSDWPDFKAF